MSQSLIVKEGTTVYWRVSKTNYVTQSGSEVIRSNTTKNIELFLPETRTFNYTGAVQTYTIPSGCTKLIVDAVGAAGGCNVYNNAGGKGGRVQCTLNVTEGQTLYIYVGGKGVDSTSTNIELAGGYNGGGKGGGYYSSARHAGAGSGGGSTDIRIDGTELTNRKIVAGAGGGSFGGNYSSNISVGGDGGGLIGGDAGNLTGSYATGGTQTSGGIGGPSGGEGTATNGSFGKGGNGYKSNTASVGYYAGGGGSGWYGGGGGYGYSSQASGGGGGSSYTDPTLCTDVVHTQGYSSATGNGWITITTAV